LIGPKPARPRPNFSKPDQARPRKTKKKTGKIKLGFSWIFLDFLGFLRPIRGFSIGYEQSGRKKFSRPHGAPAPDIIARRRSLFPEADMRNPDHPDLFRLQE
jgi:hypothetical protein